MKWVEPTVYKIAETRIDPDQLDAFLRALGADEWLEAQPWHGTAAKGVNDAEILTEVAGRSCYKSFGVGLNPNITRIRADSREYIENVLRKGDGSIFEHPGCTFAFMDCSRIFTHELVRHRAGTAISQESLRYVRPKELRITLVPGSELALLPNLDELAKALDKTYAIYEKLVDENIKREMPFDEKKAWTSALRRMLPDGIATNIVWTANHRALRWVLEMRTAPGAEAEMRYIFDKVGAILKRDFPIIYGDFVTTPHEDKVGAQWTPQIRSKV